MARVIEKEQVCEGPFSGVVSSITWRGEELRGVQDIGPPITFRIKSKTHFLLAIPKTFAWWLVCTALVGALALWWVS